jgi:hypothetical protein
MKLSIGITLMLLLSGLTLSAQQRDIKGERLLLDNNILSGGKTIILKTPTGAAFTGNSYTLTLPVGLPDSAVGALTLTNGTGIQSFLNKGTEGSFLAIVGGTPAWVDTGSAALPFWRVGGNSNPSSTFIGNNSATGNLDIRAGNATRININGTSGLTSINNGLSVAGAAAADNRTTIGNATNAGSVILSDGSNSTATINTSALAANHTYTFPNVGTADSVVTIAAASGQGNANQVLASRGTGLPGQWVDALTSANVLTGTIAIAAASFTTTITVPGTFNVLAAGANGTRITLTYEDSGGAPAGSGAVYVTGRTTGLGGSFTVTNTGGFPAGSYLHYTIINP